MAQTVLFLSSSTVPGSANYSIDLKKDSLIHLQNQGLRPKISHLFFIPLPSASYSFSSSSRTFITALAFFKTKTPSKVVKSKPKPKVEDAIFGSSGGFGFTKVNELFVGRVAMLGFSAPSLGEAITGKGIIAQLNLETGMPIYEALLLFTLLGAIGALVYRGKFLYDLPTELNKAVIPPGKGLSEGQGGPFNKTKIERLLMCWWAFTGLTHIIIEGYFVFSPELFKDKTGFFLAEVWKEYSKADSRYAGRDAGVVTIEGLTAVLEGPASLLAVYTIATGKSYNYILQFAISLGQLYGVAVYYITAILEGDNFSASSFYYYAYYIGANALWTSIPSIIAIRSWRKICAAFQVQQGGQIKKPKVR
ncbi:hypothetical protein JHK87_035541 [Glycine soja]|nr:hypothetical protein JHK87_035541 [Glycine soja]